ncbi:mothers against decapentaplegic homolog 6 [Hylaeus anthracinus]|uniref:mothers against decapentaplegic homolog 6 n=1 Tax=Hylaeus anthracinus TaxID=313031 RepID=UPI0023B8A92A|nr:mothers against decapentaplegic homolog 6 [Hylaeus anthracinus]
MFMFWSKRTALTRRLLKAKVCGEHETECEAQEDSSRIHRANNTAGTENDTSNVTGTRGVRGASSGGVVAGGGGGGRIASSRLHQGCCGGDQSQDDDEDPVRVLRCKELLKSLKENQLEMLVTAVESCGADLGSCVLVPRHHPEDVYDADQQYYRPHRYNHHNNHYHYHHPHHNHYHNRHHRRHHRSSSLENDDEQNSGSEDSCASPMRNERCRPPMRGAIENAPIDPHLLCCQIWRWPDLAHSSELKTLPVCHSAKDPVYICCNPYHWSRLCKPESPPPPYCLIADRLRPEDRAPSEGDQRRCKNSTPLPLPGSLTTNGEGEMGQKEWCTLAYWELGGRVGRLYPVEPSTVNVFDSLHDGDGLCLATLAENHVAPPAVQRTRSKIGLGLMLSQEVDGVWAYNRSESPIFVNSPTLDDPESRTLLVYRVPPGFCLNIFDRTKVLQLPYGGGSTRTSSQTTGFASGPVDINSVRISFAKGWGPKYARQEVTSCPCWLEVLLAPCR